MFVWDVESRLPKLDQDDSNEAWEEYKMICGISCAVAIPLYEEGVKIYTDQDEVPNDIESLRKDLLEAKFAVSYNGIKWDRVVVANTTGRPCPGTNEVDLYRIIRTALGETKWEKGTWKLGEVCQRTFGRGKTRSGASAPSLVARGQWGTLIEYCYLDCLLTKKLFFHMLEFGYVVAPFNRIIKVGGVLKSELERTGASKTLPPRA